MVVVLVSVLSLVVSSLAVDVVLPRVAVAAAPKLPVAAVGSFAPAMWVAFMANYYGGGSHVIYLTGDTAGTANVTVPGLSSSFASIVSIAPHAVTAVTLPAGVEMTTTDGVENLGVRIASSVPVSVFGLSRQQYTSDGFLGLPPAALGTEYRIMSYGSDLPGSEFAVVGTEAATRVTITPSVTTGVHAAGVPYVVLLGEGQVYQLQNRGYGDLTGTLVKADKPVAVFGGHQCARVPAGVTACDHLAEQLTPVSSWGSSFVVVPLATRVGGDTIRVVAAQDSTVVTVNGGIVSTLNAGQFYDSVRSALTTITSSKPVLVAQFSNGASFDNVSADPFMVLVTPFEQFRRYYTLATPAGFANSYVNIVVPSASIGGVRFDGNPVDPNAFTAIGAASIGATSFSGAQIRVEAGAHTVASLTPVGVTLYAFDYYDSYGVPGGGTVPSTFPPPRTVESQNGPRAGAAHAGDPVTLWSGNLSGAWDDLPAPAGIWGLDWSRSYNSRDSKTGVVGVGWSTIADTRLVLNADGSYSFHDQDGREVDFLVGSSGEFVRPEGVDAELSTSATGPLLTWFTGAIWQFDATGNLVSKTGWEGQTVAYTWTDGKLSTITGGAGYALTLTYTGSLLTNVTASTGRSVAYGFDAANVLASVSVDGRLVHTVTSDASGRLQQLADATGVVLMANTFDSSNRVISQSSSAGSPVTFAYDTAAFDRDTTTVTDTVTLAAATFEFDKGGRLVRATDPNGFVSGAQFDVAGNKVASSSRTAGTSSATYDSSGRPLTVTSAESGLTTIVYDTSGRITSKQDDQGRTTTYTYDGAERAPSTTTMPDGTVSTADIVDGLVMSATDADGVSMSYTYDALRRVASVKDGYLNTTSYTYNARGQVLTTTDPNGAVTTTVYDDAGRRTSVKDALLNVTSYTYDNADRVLTVTDPTGAITSNTYDTAGRLFSVTDPSGAVTTNTYDTAGRLKTVTKPGGAVTTNNYDSMNRVSSVVDPLGRTTSYTYDAEDRLTKTTDSAGAVTETVYDAAGRGSIVRDALGRVRQTEYDSLGRVASVTDQAGQVSTMTYDANDRVTSTTDVRGATSISTFTLAGRPKTSTAPTGIVTTNTYDLAGRLMKQTGPTGDALTVYDAAGRVKTTTSPGGLGRSVTYDLLGRVLTSTDPAGVITTNTWSKRGQLLTTTTTGAGTTTNTYNADGTLATVKDPTSGVTTFGYDGRKNRTSRTNALTGIDAWEYDLADQLISTKDPLNRQTTMAYDAAGRMETVTDPSARTVTYNYDLAGQPTTKTVSGGATYRYDYDLLGRRTAIKTSTGKFSSTWAPGNLLTSRTDSAGRTTAWNYDAAGRLTTMTYPGDSTVKYTYDTASRLASITPGEVMADTFTGLLGAVPDSARWTVATTPTGTPPPSVNGNKLQVSLTATGTTTLTSRAPKTADADVTFTYSASDTTAANRSNLVVTARKAASAEYRVTFPSIDGTATVAKKVAGVVTTISTFAIPGTGERKVRFQVQGTNVRTRVWQAADPEPTTWTNDVVDTAVTGAGSVGFSVTRVAGTNTYLVDDWSQSDPTNTPGAFASYSYNADGQYTAETVNGGSRALTYTAGRLTNYAETLGTVTKNTSLTYDTSGRIKSDLTGTLTKTYGYDLAGQLTKVTPSSGSATTYTYDKLGRRVSTKVGSTTTTNIYDAASQLKSAGATTYAYDDAGRRTMETAGTAVTTYTYDPQGRLDTMNRGVTTITRGYDPDDNLTSVTNGATVTGIDWDPTSGVPQPIVVGGKRNIRGIDGWIAQRNGFTDTNLSRDIHGSVIAPAAPARAASYDAFGKPTGANTLVPELGYRGEITIDSLTYLRARNYDAANGVFTSRDPLDGINGTPVVGNSYHYANNNPLMNADPLGLSTIPKASQQAGNGVLIPSPVMPSASTGSSGPIPAFNLRSAPAADWVRVGLYTLSEADATLGSSQVATIGLTEGSTYDHEYVVALYGAGGSTTQIDVSLSMNRTGTKHVVMVTAFGLGLNNAAVFFPRMNTSDPRDFSYLMKQMPGSVWPVQQLMENPPRSAVSVNTANESAYPSRVTVEVYRNDGSPAKGFSGVKAIGLDWSPKGLGAE
jgi:RHS repeat-associated protein